MARYEHLPIYKKAMDLTIFFEKIVRNFSRYHKYTLGNELRKESREVVVLIVRANATQERLPLLLFQIRTIIPTRPPSLRFCKKLSKIAIF